RAPRNDIHVRRKCFHLRGNEFRGRRNDVNVGVNVFNLDVTASVVDVTSSTFNVNAFTFEVTTSVADVMTSTFDVITSTVNVMSYSAAVMTSVLVQITFAKQICPQRLGNRRPIYHLTMNYFKFSIPVYSRIRNFLFLSETRQDFQQTYIIAARRKITAFIQKQFIDLSSAIKNFFIEEILGIYSVSTAISIGMTIIPLLAYPIP